MPRELITLQVGQCGNQIGARFWELAAAEHRAQLVKGAGASYDEALSTFFRNVEDPADDGTGLAVGSPVEHLQARAVLLDTEEGVVGQLQRDPQLRGLFAAPHQYLTPDVSGAGNNWAHGTRVAPYFRAFGSSNMFSSLLIVLSSLAVLPILL
jgi:tubulin epsilon